MPPAIASGIPKQRHLPQKESSLFKEVLTLYENKQLKKGLKTADQILKKFPEHGETLCMKGLILTHMGRRDEGKECVKKGMRFDLTSHICWHVYGLIEKGEKNYEGALKSYSQALRIDRENINILRDTAHLQTQLRVYDGLIDTRHTILFLRPNLRQNWIGLAVAYHLNGNLREAKNVLEQYEHVLTNVTDYDVEHSEVMLYHVRVLEDLGEANEALALLDTCAKSRAIVDLTSIMEYRARLHTKLAVSDAEHTWRALFEQNGDNYSYLRGFLVSKSIDVDRITDENRNEALELLSELSQISPRAAAPRRLALTVATGERFQELVKPYLLNALKKGVPSLFVDIKSLYVDAHKRQIVEDIVEELRESLVAGNPAPASPPGADEPPTTYLWTLYFLAQHHSFLSRPAQALSLLDIAVQHTPTLPEIHTCRARVLKRAGDLLGAAKSLESARLLDGQDRFLNTKCAKYRFRAGLIDQANEILGLFTKKDAASPGADLEDMQSTWYLLEQGDAHNRAQQLALALKKYVAVQKLFEEIEDDQYDFHGYSLRKFTINIYLQLIAWEDRIWVAVHDDPTLTAPPGSNSVEDKKAKKKAKKAAQKLQETTKKAAGTANDEKNLEPSVLVDDDPDGSKLIAADDGLERAAKLLNPIVALLKDNVDVWIATYDVAIRRTSSLPQEPPAPIGPIFSEALASLYPQETSSETQNSQYLQRNSSSARAIFAATKVSMSLGAHKEVVEALLFTTLAPNVQLDIKTALAILTFLGDIQSPRHEEYRISCDTRFEHSTVFKPAEYLDALRKDVPKAEVSEEVDKAEVVG
ncbi:hypothetical protein HWV62_9339 [Athelia sp. TMB]|nr:hypothetical protein HWV62_9339 [Athelia sp. TMB]